MNIVKAALSSIYGTAVEARNFLYEESIWRPIHVGKPVISIGNLTVGGTGKTPIVDMTVRLLLMHDHRPGIVCRNYRGTGTRPERVDPSQPRVFGDEACWYATRHPGLPVWSGPSKSQTAKAMAEQEDVDLIIVDDGYQHRRLHREVDILLLDATDDKAAYRIFPWGRGREPWGNHHRATSIILTKTNLAKHEQIIELKNKLGNKRQIFEATSNLRQARIPAGPVLLVSGIARPESFNALVEKLLPGRPKETLSFVDHHLYSAADVKTIELLAANCGAVAVLITEKDATKLQSLWRSKLPLIPLSLEVNLKQPLESYYGILGHAFGS